MEKICIWILVITIEALLALADNCVFPRAWKGRYYVNGNYEFEVFRHHITKRGNCRERKGDLYLVKNDNLDCSRCMLIMSRHRNILQYKESPCIPGDGSLLNVCNQIKLHYFLFTAVREPTVPVRCPFQGPYHIQYKNQSTGECDNPDSRARPCAGDAKFRFNFRHCPANRNTYNQDMDFDCLATWKDGSQMYMYGKFTAPWLTSRDSQYRCFMYKSYRNVIYLSVSADPSCIGLTDPREGDFVLELNRDSHKWPKPECNFPHWLTQHNWLDMSGKHVYQTELSRGQEIWMGHRKHKSPHEFIARDTYRCKTSLDREDDSRWTLTSFTSHGCSSMYQCMHIIKKKEGLVEFIQGSMRRNEPEECDLSETHGHSGSAVHLLIPETPTHVPCPLSGHYQTEQTTSCHVEVQAQCSNHSADIQLLMSCQNKKKVTVNMECISTWRNQSSQYVIMRETASKAAHCYKITVKRQVIDMYLDPTCNIGSPIKPLGIDRLVLKKNPDKCQEKSEPVHIIPSRGSGLQVDTPTNGRGGSHTGSGSGGSRNSQSDSNTNSKNPSQRQGTRSPKYNLASDKYPTDGCDIPRVNKVLYLLLTLLAGGLIQR